MPRRRRPPLAEPEAFERLDISPLIDMSFLLLIFFLVTSIMQQSETELTTRLPDRLNLEDPDLEALTVDIQASADGTVLYNGTAVSTDLNDRKLTTLVAELKNAKSLASSTTTPIIASIDIADDATQQRFADLLNALAGAEIENIALRGGL